MQPGKFRKNKIKNLWKKKRLNRIIKEAKVNKGFLLFKSLQPKLKEVEIHF
jgi:hypothetical protein